MKKTVSLLLALLLTTGMAAISACGPVDPDTSTPGTSQSAEDSTSDAPGASESPDEEEKLEIREAALAAATVGKSYTVDLSGIKVVGENGAESDLAVSVKNGEVKKPDGTAVKLQNNAFTPDVAGSWSVVVYVEGHSEIAEKTLTIEAEYDTSGVGLSSYDSLGFESIWDGYISFGKVTRNDAAEEDKFYGSENYSAKMTMVEGKETKSIRLWMDMDEQDWSGYDYVKFYVYNDTNVSVRIALCVDDDNNSLMRPSVGNGGVWTPVVIPLVDGATIPSNRSGWGQRVEQPLNRVQTLGLYLTIAENNNNWSTGNAFKEGSIYFSAIQGGNYETEDEDVLIPVEEGINPSNVARIRMINHYNIVESTEQKAPDEAMSLKLYALKDFPSGDDLVITYNHRYYLQSDYTGDVYMWVYNACASAVNIVGKTTETLQPNEGKYVTFTASSSEIVIKVGSSVMKTGDAIYFGNVYKGAAE